MLNPQLILGLADELVVDLFAGGGGASTGIEAAIGRHVDIAVNHNPDAISMHEANHPQTRHFLSDVWEVDPLEVTGGMPVGLLHASPDCTHHSQARGGQPRNAKIRALAWVVHRWAGKLSRRGKGPKLMTLENVEQMLQWSPLIAKRCAKTGRVVKLDGSVAQPGERVPVEQQFLVPDPKRKGKTWGHFVEGLRRMGYAVQWRKIVAADFGAPTTRERLFMIARCDGEPIVWPDATHAKKPAKGQKPWRAAAECIDFSLDCPSIFTRERPLAEATMRRIAKGVRKYVLEAAEPFIVAIGQTGGNGDRVRSKDDPLGVIVTKAEQCIAAPTLVQAGYGERDGQAPRALDLQAPLGVVVAGGVKHAIATPMLIQAGHGEGSKATPRWSHGTNDIQGPVGTVTASGGGQALASVFLAQANNGPSPSVGHAATRPVSTITNSGSQQQLVAALLSHAYSSNTCGGEGNPTQPAKTITTGGHHAVVECTLSPEDEAGALRVAAFLLRYYGEGGQHGDLRDPAATITTKDRLALVTVHIKGTPYVIVDIGLRMLQPRELYAAQGFPASYVIEHGHDGRRFTKSAQVRMCGNSVSPKPMEALIRANYTEQQAERRAA